MGCTQSKTTNNTVLDGSKGDPLKSSAQPLATQPVEAAELTASRTVSSDDHDLIATAVSSDKPFDEAVADKEAVEPCTEVSKNVQVNPPSPVQEANPAPTVPKDTTVVDDKPVEENETQPEGSPKSPRRRRRRSNSSGVHEMAMGGEETEEVIKEVEPILQPVVARKAEQSEVTNTEGKGASNPAVSEEKAVKETTDSPTISQEIIAASEERELVAVEGKTEVDDQAKEVVKAASKVKACAGCDKIETKKGSFKVCAKCKVVSYCGRECQVNHWKQHKKTCGNSTMDVSSAHLLEAWGVSPTNSSSNSSVDLGDSLHVSPSNSVHDDAVKELEAVLQRLRSEDPDLNDDVDKSTEAVEVSKESGGVPQESDPIVEAREAAVDTPAVDENVAPPASEPFVDENTPIVLPPIPRCAACNAFEKTAGSFKSCAKCRDVFYCNRTCQKGHFKVHKKTCCKQAPRKSVLGGKDSSLNPIQA